MYLRVYIENDEDVGEVLERLFDPHALYLYVREWMDLENTSYRDVLL